MITYLRSHNRSIGFRSRSIRPKFCSRKPYKTYGYRYLNLIPCAITAHFQVQTGLLTTAGEREQRTGTERPGVKWCTPSEPRFLLLALPWTRAWAGSIPPGSVTAKGQRGVATPWRRPTFDQPTTNDDRPSSSWVQDKRHIPQRCRRRAYNRPDALRRRSPRRCLRRLCGPDGGPPSRRLRPRRCLRPPTNGRRRGPAVDPMPRGRRLAAGGQGFRRRRRNRPRDRPLVARRRQVRSEAPGRRGAGLRRRNRLVMGCRAAL